MMNDTEGRQGGNLLAASEHTAGETADKMLSLLIKISSVSHIQSDGPPPRAPPLIACTHLENNFLASGRKHLQRGFYPHYLPRRAHYVDIFNLCNKRHKLAGAEKRTRRYACGTATLSRTR